MNVTLIRSTPGADLVCGKAAAICTGYKGDPRNALRGALASGHESVAEHASFTFEVGGVSRVLLAQLTRHRIASFSVVSQRYVNQADADVVMPPTVMDNEQAMELAANLICDCADLYLKLIQMGIPEEDARYFLPQGVTTKLVLTMNARELRHFFSLRCCNRAQWQIRTMADLMLRECRTMAPILFEDAGPGCVRGGCPEGKRSCGKPRRMDESVANE